MLRTCTPFLLRSKIEFINRPLTYISDDINELEALTPSHLICGRRLKSVPTTSSADVDNDPDYLDQGNLNERYVHLSKLINKWQELWKREYLSSLREKFYGVSPSKPPNNQLKVGDVVMVQSMGPRVEWPLGRVEVTYPDDKGAVRLVKLKMKSGTALRTVEKLVPLECEVESFEPNDEVIATSEDDSPLPEEVTGRPPRRAATKFRDRLKGLIDSGGLI